MGVSRKPLHTSVNKIIWKARVGGGGVAAVQNHQLARVSLHLCGLGHDSSSTSQGPPSIFDVLVMQNHDLCMGVLQFLISWTCYIIKMATAPFHF